MATLFRSPELYVTDEWVRTSSGTYGIGEIREVWVGRSRVSRVSRLTTAGALIGVLLVVIGVVGALGWLASNWFWILIAPVIFVAAGHIGMLDPIAIYLEKRHHELWIATESVAVRVYKANGVEARKALRAINRARERFHDVDGL
jgi:hypothetical protein